MSLLKLKIQSFNSPDCVGNPLKTVYAMVNPESYEQDYKIRYEGSDILGDPAKTLFFSGMESGQLSLKKLLVDGTGVIPLEGADNVQDYLTILAGVVYQYNGTLHSPPYVKITWGNLTFKGVCTSFKVNYTLFNPDGTALRALVDLDFSSTVDPETKTQEAVPSSPDLTHIRTVRAGDSLPLMTYQIYGDPSYYLEVARVNGLSSIHDIKPGDQLHFPPLKK